MLTVYNNHDRRLLFHGDVAAAEQAGIKLHRKSWELTISGRRRKIVNTNTAPGHLSLWLASA